MIRLRPYFWLSVAKHDFPTWVPLQPQMEQKISSDIGKPSNE